MEKINVAILASGSGTNAENIVNYFKDHPHIRIKSIWSNKKDAFVLKRAKKLNLPAHTFSGNEMENGQLLESLSVQSIHYLVLAGFLLKIPDHLTQAFPDRIINIHPALLPRYGGKGMYGDHVHESVLRQKDSQSGITIHLVNENYDEGRILFQAMCEVRSDDTVRSLANRIHELEYTYYPKIIEDYILDNQAQISKNR